MNAISVEDYVSTATEFLVDPPEVTPEGLRAMWFVSGLCSEAGELVQRLRRIHLHKVECPREVLTDEIGDVLWFLTAIAKVHGIHLQEVINGNAYKMRDKFPQGYQIKINFTKEEDALRNQR